MSDLEIKIYGWKGTAVRMVLILMISGAVAAGAASYAFYEGWRACYNHMHGAENSK